VLDRIAPKQAIFEPMPRAQVDPHLLAKEPNRALWRYMDLAGLLSVLENQALWFSKPAFLSDPSEGTLPASLVRFRDESDEDGQFCVGGKEFMNANELVLAARATVFVNCWHRSDSESAAMWAIYAASKGLAVKTTLDRLCGSLDVGNRDIHIDGVEYLDFAAPDPSRVKMPWLIKRNAFAYEQEVRAWTFGYDKHPEPQPYGALIKIDPNQLIESLYLAPKADPWLDDLLRSLLRRYGITAEIIRSSLYDSPKINLPSRLMPRRVVAPGTARK
jgi:hypothetical protein